MMISGRCCLSPSLVGQESAFVIVCRQTVASLEVRFAIAYFLRLVSEGQ